MTLVWRSELDDNGDAVSGLGSFQTKQLNGLHPESWFIGLRERLEKDGSLHWIHCIMNSRPAAALESYTYYVRVTPDANTPAFVTMVRPGSAAIGRHAVFVTGTTLQTSGYNFARDQAFIAGSLVDYTTFPSATPVSFVASAYAVWPTLEDNNSCVRYETTDGIAPIETTSSSLSTCGYQSLVPSTTAFTDYELLQSNYKIEVKKMEFYIDLEYGEQKSEAACNVGDVPITATQTRETVTKKICYNFNKMVAASFIEEAATAPVCDAAWLYFVNKLN